LIQDFQRVPNRLEVDMKFRLFMIVALAVLQGGTGLALADQEDWSGMYMGVDPIDGSVNHTSIWKNEDGSYAIASTATKVTSCKGAEGWWQGTGTVIKGVLVDKGASLTCEGTEGVRILPELRYIRGDRPGIVFMTTSVRSKGLVYHRIGG
jgi:hypothetical protein